MQKKGHRVDAIFRKLESIHGTKWSSQTWDKNQDVMLAKISTQRMVWLDYTKDLTDSQVTDALHKAAKHLFINITQFRKDALGILDPEEAWLMKDNDPLASLVYELTFKSTMTEAEAHNSFIHGYNHYSGQIFDGKLTIDQLRPKKSDEAAEHHFAYSNCCNSLKLTPVEHEVFLEFKQFFEDNFIGEELEGRLGLLFDNFRLNPQSAIARIDKIIADDTKYLKMKKEEKNKAILDKIQNVEMFKK